MKNLDRAKIGNIYDSSIKELYNNRPVINPKSFCVPCWMDSKNRKMQEFLTLGHENFV